MDHILVFSQWYNYGLDTNMLYPLWQEESSSYTYYSIWMFLCKRNEGMFIDCILLMCMRVHQVLRFDHGSHEFFCLGISHDSIVKVLWRASLNNNCKCFVDSSIAKVWKYLIGHLWYTGILNNNNNNINNHNHNVVINSDAEDYEILTKIISNIKKIFLKSVSHLSSVNLSFLFILFLVSCVRKQLDDMDWSKFRNQINKPYQKTTILCWFWGSYDVSGTIL